MKKALIELINLKKNSRTNQISFDIRKKKLKEWGLDIEDIENLKIKIRKQDREW